jgi:hypothetical protein
VRAHRTVARVETLLALCVGLALAAAAGMRVFLPLLVLGLAGRAELVPLAGEWAWVASTTALIGLGAAALLEVAAYYVPWVDQALDVIATPAAVLAGMMATAAVLVDLPPLVTYALVVIGGGGVAGMAQGASVLARLTSTSLTGGFGNPLVATAEWLGALTLALLAVLLPVLGALLAVALLFLLVRRARRARRPSPPSQARVP